MPQHLDIDSLVAAMTMAQKAGLTSGFDAWQSKAVPDLGITSVRFSDGPHGVRREVASQVSLPATCFPTESALGATWDRELVARVGAAIGREASAQGVDVILGPGINMKRTPLCGRNFEYFSEDPVHTGELGAAYVTGVQSVGVGACIKHFAANNQEQERDWVSAEIDERTLRELYTAAFEHIVTHATPWSVMCSYNRVNGTHASQHRGLLTDLLRIAWGFDGVVISDWGAVHDRVAALAAGLDVEMPAADGVPDQEILDAVMHGHVDEAVLDVAVRRVLGLWLKVVAARESRPARSGPLDADGDLARTAAAAGIVLLRNIDETLPLDPSSVGSLAVIGRFAATPRIQGGGSADVNPSRVDNALDALRALAPQARIDYASGFRTDADDRDEGLLEEAVSNAEAAAVAVVFVGLTDTAESEGYDRASIELPANQTRLLDAVARTGTPMVVVLTNGSAVSLDPWHDASSAIVESWLSGQSGGGALADVLFGVVNPSGRLAETFPLRLKDTPSFLNYPGENGVVRYGEGVFIGYRWYDALDLAVRYPFGHGLSYTTMEYSDLRIDDVDALTGVVHLTVTVANTGTRDGSEVVQVYVGEDHSAVRRPVRELRAFDKVEIAAGTTSTVRFALDSRDFAYFDVVAGGFRRPGGTFRIEVGASSRDLRLSASVELADDPQREPLIPDAELADIV